MADFNITVDTQPMADSLDYVNSNVRDVTSSVVAMQSAVVIAQQRASEQICHNVDTGFFVLMKSQFDQKIAAISSKMLSTMQLMETLEEPSVVVLLDHVTDVRNMGAIARTAECTGVAALVVPDHGSAAINEDAIKTSSGALLRLPVCREQNLKTVVNLAKQCGYQVVAATEKGAVHYREVDFRKPTLLIMGNEETGISTELLKMSDVRAKLPIVGEVASLNVSVAAGVFMYEALEQRSTR